jgi:hypothetical protein
VCVFLYRWCFCFPFGLMHFYNFVFYNGCNITGKFLHDFVMWCICYQTASMI